MFFWCSSWPEKEKISFTRHLSALMAFRITHGKSKNEYVFPESDRVFSESDRAFPESDRTGRFYPGNITFLLPETTQARNDSAAGRSRHDDLRELHDVMESSSRRAAFEPRPHQGASWPSTAGFTSSSRLWLLRRRAARGEFGPHSRRPEKKLLHPTPPAAVPIPVCLEISPT